LCRRKVVETGTKKARQRCVNIKKKKTRSKHMKKRAQGRKRIQKGPVQNVREKVRDVKEMDERGGKEGLAKRS